MLFIIGLSDDPLRQIACSFNGFFVIVIVKLKQKNIIKKGENRGLREFGYSARNPAKKDQIWQINIFCIIESQKFFSF